MADKSGNSEHSGSQPAPALLVSILDQLACPACYDELRVDGPRLVCANCRRLYPILDGIPVLIAEQAERSPDDSGIAGVAPGQAER
jgi:hypothetical protein